MKDTSPSSFIPFCWFGEREQGLNIKEFSVPVCDSFNPIHRNDQVCYEIDPNDLIGEDDDKVKAMKTGLYFIIDENEDRVIGNTKHNEPDNNIPKVQEFMRENTDEQGTQIFVDTIGEVLYINIFIRYFIEHLDSLMLTPGWKYNLNSIKKVTVTEEFWNLDESSKGCRNETFTKCKTDMYIKRAIETCGCLPLRMRPDLVQVGILQLNTPHYLFNM